MNKLNHSVQGLAEISVCAHNPDARRRFYEEVMRLEALQEVNESEGSAVFCAVGAGGITGG